MAFIKIIFSILLISDAAFGDWGLVLQKGSYLGNTALGGIYTWKEKHSVEISIGNYMAADSENYQINLGYRWSPWQVPVSTWRWAPAQLGIFLMGTLNNREYFTESPDIYPSDDYYDQTAVRGAFQISSGFYFRKEKAAFIYHFSILENGLIAIYNNDWRNLNYFWASGFSLQIYF
jgi:hypothetical protein